MVGKKEDGKDGCYEKYESYGNDGKLNTLRGAMKHV